jgi:hypothetical protein
MSQSSFSIDLMLVDSPSSTTGPSSTIGSYTPQCTPGPSTSAFSLLQSDDTPRTSIIHTAPHPDLQILNRNGKNKIVLFSKDCEPAFQLWWREIKGAKAMQS